MKVIRTVEDKQIAIQERDGEQRKLGKAIDRVLHRGNATRDGEELGCGGSGICPWVARGAARFFGLTRRTAVSTGEPEARSRSSEISRAVLGMAPSKKKTPAVKLEAAANAMRQRMEVLESRASNARQAAQSYMQSGNRACAMRDLKRSKVFEKQAVSLQTVMDAVDTQSAILEQTALQKQVTAALGETAKNPQERKRPAFAGGERGRRGQRDERHAR